MNFIPCDDNCIYQEDGYCKLESSSIVTNSNGNCIYQIEKTYENFNNYFLKKQKRL